jgi:hypothetical protein
VAKKLDVDDTNGGLRRSSAHARGREVPGFYRRPVLAKVVRARPRVGEVVAWARGGDVGRGTTASPVVGRRMVGVRRFAQPVGARRVATGDWARTPVRSCGRTSSHQDASASGPSGGRGARCVMPALAMRSGRQGQNQKLNYSGPRGNKGSCRSLDPLQLPERV